MGQCVKFSEEAMSQIREKIGLKSGTLDLETGIWKVNSRTDIEQAEKMYDLDKSVKENVYASENDLSLEERRLIIGTQVQVGSIVRIKKDGKVCHIVIVSVDGQWYEGTKIVLDSRKYNPETEILLTKGKNVLYRNLSYKNEVRVLNERFYGFTEKNFIKGRAGKIVGKVIDEETMKKILKLIGFQEDDESEKTTEKLETGAEHKEIPKTAVGNECGEKTVEITREEQPEEKDEKSEEINFETIIQEAQTYEEWWEKLKLPIGESFFTDTIRICMRTNCYGMKKIIPLVQKEHSSEGLTQNAIKNIINIEFNTWLENFNANMKERNLSYFLKVITKKYKNSYKN